MQIDGNICISILDPGKGRRDEENQLNLSKGRMVDGLAKKLLSISHGKGVQNDKGFKGRLCNEELGVAGKPCISL